ncbi:hypothetical protein NE237_017658 [Protea cynaroides]|uniref:LOB domain-containing protein n=1 Tax=Protea cynaroides TaxID=273540 RepID=A0A9Q0K8F5_9MAGN|nr:hypothetical protein NE237_017658 [Protea cynaroides]
MPSDSIRDFIKNLQLNLILKKYIKKIKKQNVSKREILFYGTSSKNTFPLDFLFLSLVLSHRQAGRKPPLHASFCGRKWVTGCIFAPYFNSEQGAALFATVHKVFGACNVSKLLLHIPIHKRLDAVVTVMKLKLVSVIPSMVALLTSSDTNLALVLASSRSHLATLELPSPTPPPPPPDTLLNRPSLSIADLSSALSMRAASFDLMLFDPLVQPPWTLQRRKMDLPQYGGIGRNPSYNSSSSTAATATGRVGVPRCLINL